MRKLIFLLFLLPLLGADVDTLYEFNESIMPAHMAYDGISGTYIVSGIQSEILHITSGEIKSRVSLNNDYDISDISRSGLKLILAAESSSELIFFDKKLMQIGSQKLEYDGYEIQPTEIYATSSRRLFIVDRWNRQIYIKDEDYIREYTGEFRDRIGFFPDRDALLLIKDGKAHLLFDIARKDSSIKIPERFDSDLFILGEKGIFAADGADYIHYDLFGSMAYKMSFDNDILDIDIGYDSIFLLTKKAVYKVAIR
ncbi:MAG: hypothetical protein ACLFSQ_10615 [Candidatus Zixiibacteriota bacterium]